MTIKERNELIKYCKSVSDEILENEYYSYVFESLGSQAEIMEDMCYDERDIEERRAYEKYCIEAAHIYEKECLNRNITLWK